MTQPRRLTVLSRASALAALQADLVAKALVARWPGLTIARETRTAEGDRDATLDLWAAPSKGVFTADLSSALTRHEADLVVHSWKDLPIDQPAGTVVAATLERADPRDVLLIRRSTAAARPPTIRVLSSSPRRAHEVATAGAGLLPWQVQHWDVRAVRGNIPTRLAKLVAGDGDALIVAKAALDRLLSPAAPAEVTAAVRRACDACRWMVLPLRDFPTAAAQGALAIEIASGRPDIAALVGAINHAPTWHAVERERDVLRSFGGGCHDPVGVTVLPRDYGEVVSIRANVPGKPAVAAWRLDHPTAPMPPSTSADRIWPRPNERDFTTRRPLAVGATPPSPALWITRAEALPAHWSPTDTDLVWAAGRRTWERLAARGIWVNGCADGLGDPEPPAIDRLAGYDVEWCRLTHAGSTDRGAVATYAAEVHLSEDLPLRTHFYWTSGAAFLQAVARHPSVAGGWHASGPGQTARVIAGTLTRPGAASIWLDYDQWLHHVLA